jgi:hypothetical protein
MITWQGLVGGFGLGFAAGALAFALILWSKIGLPPKKPR